MKRTFLLIIGLIVILAFASLLLTKYSAVNSLSSNGSVDTTKSVPTSLPQGDVVPFSLTLPQGYVAAVFTKNLGNPRDLELSAGGTVLVSVPDSNSVIALSDENGDYKAEQHVALRGSNVVHGLAFHGDTLFVAEKNAVNEYSWSETTKTATFTKKVLDLPGNADHIYRTLVVGRDNKLYISIGSNCNVCIEPNPMVGTVITAHLDGTNATVFARGQRNAPFLVENPTTHDIWATGMGRDYLGDNLPADEINILKEGDYGWPICYGNNIHDTSFDKNQYIQNPCKNKIPPIFEIPAHSAPLGLAFIPESFNPDWKGDLLVAYHGSWNRSRKTGYKIVHMKVSGNKITAVEDFITGFLDGNTVYARPVDLLFDKKGNLYISDDKSGNVFIVSHK